MNFLEAFLPPLPQVPYWDDEASRQGYGSFLWSHFAGWYKQKLVEETNFLTLHK